MAKLTRVILILLGALLLGAGLIAAAFFGSRAMEKRTYKLDYAGLIRRYAGDYALDPYLVAAMIHVESGNRPAVVSPAGAMGLMQVMPDTGAWIAHKLEDTEEADFDPAALLEPETSIRYGCWYLRFLLDRFAGNVRYAVIAYNAGHGNLEKWLENDAFASDGVLKRIPFAETDAYVQKVSRAREKYRELYEKELS